MSDISTTSWSEVDANNNQTPPEGWPPGMFPNAVEPTARMNMGAVKRFWDRLNPVYPATLATTDSFVVTPTVGIGGYGLYERWRARFPGPNTTTSPTVNISAVGAQLLQKYSQGALVNLAVGDIQAQDLGFWWNGSQMVLESPAQSAYLTNSLSGDVALTVQNSYQDGPSIAQGPSGLWFVTGTVTVQDTSLAATFKAKLWDGTTVIASGMCATASANYRQTISLSGVIKAPAGNLRISVADANATPAGAIKANDSSNGADSTITAIRIG